LWGEKIPSRKPAVFLGGVIIYHVTIYRNTKINQYSLWILTICIVYISPKIKKKVVYTVFVSLLQ